MISLILSDYKSSFKQQLKSIVFEGYYLYFYFIILPLIFNHSSVERDIVNLLFLLPMILSLLLSRMYSNVMNKTFFLSPFSKEDRIHYYNTALCIRVVIPVTLFCCNLIIVAFIGKLTIGRIAIALLVMILFAVSTNIYTHPIVSSVCTTERKYLLNGNYELYNVLNQLTGLISMYLLVFTCEKEAVVEAWEWGVILSLIGIYLLIAIRMIMKFYCQVREVATNYEMSKQVTGEKKRK